MHKAKAFFLIFLAGFALAYLCAQEGIEDGEGEFPIDPEWGGPMPALYSMGDKTFNITAGVIFPTLFFENGNLVEKSNLFPVGGTLCLSFTSFLNSHVFLGGELSGLFNSTLAKNTLFIIPIGFLAGYQFIVWKFEIPLSVAIGISPTRFRDLNYFGMYMKAGASLFYRFSPDWSFGLNARWSWYPQWPKEMSKRADGNFVDLTLSARYHF
jgi:hypothetical protein